MTFEEFRAAARDVDDLTAEFGDGILDDEDADRAGLVIENWYARKVADGRPYGVDGPAWVIPYGSEERVASTRDAAIRELWKVKREEEDDR